MKNLLALIITAVCLLTSLAPCDASPAIDDDAQHCDSSCNFNCCSIALPQITSINTPSFTTVKIFPLNSIPHQETFVPGIEYPPNF